VNTLRIFSVRWRFDFLLFDQIYLLAEALLLTLKRRCSSYSGDVELVW